MKIFRSAVLREIGGHYRSQIFEYSVVYVMEALVMIIQATIFSTLTMALIYLSRLRRKRGTVHEPVGEKL